MKTVNVVAAVICDSFDEKKQIFAVARGYGDFKEQWEFPDEMIEGGLKLLEAKAGKWLTKDIFYDVRWLPADLNN